MAAVLLRRMIVKDETSLWTHLDAATHQIVKQALMSVILGESRAHEWHKRVSRSSAWPALLVAAHPTPSLALMSIGRPLIASQSVSSRPQRRRPATSGQ